MVELDKTDRQLLALVQKGDMCKPSTTTLAHRLGLPTTTVHNRLRRLEKDGIVAGYHASVDAKKAGKEMTVFTVVKVIYPQTYSDMKKVAEFGKKLAAIQEVQEVHVCSGDWDYLLKVKAKNSVDYYQIATNKILPLGGIEKLMSYVAYETVKETDIVTF
jgi:Lrp/AsnC family leucine-responsive transcriptional regulator